MGLDGDFVWYGLQCQRKMLPPASRCYSVCEFPQNINKQRPTHVLSRPEAKYVTMNAAVFYVDVLWLKCSNLTVLLNFVLRWVDCS